MKAVDNADVGVIVGRFHVDDLHDGHKELIQTVLDAHQKVLIFLGLSACKCTVRNPLDFESRKKMFQEHYPDVTVLYIKDTKYDDVWSKNLDRQIESVIGPRQTVMLYGSRDSFIKAYCGRYQTTELEQKQYISGTEIRKRLSINSKATKDFRAGVIWCTMNQWPTAIPVVDVAIVDLEQRKILLGRKEDEDSLRLIGGFVDPGEAWEEAVVREAKEETNLDVSDLDYIKSMVINDWRYRSEENKITTTFFVAKGYEGKPVPGDDIYELHWVNFEDIDKTPIVHNHVELINEVLKRY